MTIHQKISKSNLKEICRASGNACGGTSVDNSFYEIFTDIVGADILDSTTKEDPSFYLNILEKLRLSKEMLIRP